MGRRLWKSFPDGLVIVDMIEKRKNEKRQDFDISLKSVRRAFAAAISFIWQNPRVSLLNGQAGIFRWFGGDVKGERF